MTTQSNRWSAEDVEKIVANPAYLGIGVYERVVENDMFIQNALIAIGRNADSYYKNLENNLVEFLEFDRRVAHNDVAELRRAIEADQSNAKDTMLRFINSIRATAASMLN
jgi:hypothetical protein